MKKTRCRQCRKRLTLPADSTIDFCSGACRDRYARIREGAPHHWPKHPEEPCLYCGEGLIRYGVTCGSEVCTKSNQLYLDAYRRTGGRLDRIDYRQIAAKARGLCGICGDDLDGVESVDHVFPLAHGGDHTLDNVQMAHPACNTAKGNTLPGAIA